MRTLRGYTVSHLFGACSIVPFLPARYSYFRRLRTRPAPAQLADWVGRLARDGAVLIPDFFGQDQVATLLAAVPDASQFTVSPEGDGSLMYVDAHRLAGLRTFFEDPRLREIAQAHISDQAVPLRQTVGLKVLRGEIATFEMNYHMDTWKRRMKAFLFLHDITESEAPMTYLRGSHRGWWRLWTEARIARYYTANERGFAADTERYYLGSFWPHEVRQLKNDYGYEDLVCTGTAGTLLVFDGRGLHRATPLRGERRLILTSYWIHPGQHT